MSETSARARPLRMLGVASGVVALSLLSAAAFLALKDDAERRNASAEKGATYDLTALREVDPQLVSWRELTPVVTGMTRPRALTIAPDGRLIVAGDRRLRFFTPGGSRSADIELPGEPHCVATDDAGTIYVGYKDRVAILNRDGSTRATLPSFGDRAHLTSIARRDDELLVADAGNRAVLRCSFDGTVIHAIAGPGEEPGDGTVILPGPHLVVVPRGDGLIMVLNPGRHRIETRAEDGTLHSFVGEPGTGIDAFLGCCNPCSFALLDDGRIVTAEKGLARVKVLKPDGRLDCVIAGPDLLGETEVGLELAVDRAGRVLVLEPGKPNVRVFLPRERSGR